MENIILHTINKVQIYIQIDKKKYNDTHTLIYTLFIFVFLALKCTLIEQFTHVQTERITAVYLPWWMPTESVSDSKAP